eukprot:TRINITY_DN122371_c0_g1_i1.p1 TRINITY_DN122371_c0_g1~~TRINITY_DN122371_c0_g1_i1.p1  ORF type:complete len:168 (+),score=23.53 TRINITY_DN122371_c0_g1_i1:73-576(+)
MSLALMDEHYAWQQTIVREETQRALAKARALSEALPDGTWSGPPPSCSPGHMRTRMSMTGSLIVVDPPAVPGEKLPVATATASGLVPAPGSPPPKTKKIPRWEGLAAPVMRKAPSESDIRPEMMSTTCSGFSFGRQAAKHPHPSPGGAMRARALPRRSRSSGALLAR